MWKNFHSHPCEWATLLEFPRLIFVWYLLPETHNSLRGKSKHIKLTATTWFYTVGCWEVLLSNPRYSEMALPSLSTSMSYSASGSPVMFRAMSSSISSSRGERSVDAGLSGNELATFSVFEEEPGCCSEPPPVVSSCRPWNSLSNACALSPDPCSAFFAAIQ